MDVIVLILLKLMLLLHGSGFDLEPNQSQVMFVWDSELVNEQVLESLIEDDFDTLYIYLSASNKKEYVSALTLCETHNISVYALNGSYEWLDDYKLQDKFFKIVTEIDEMAFSNFKGVVLDIEPYVLDTKDEEQAYEDFMALITQAKSQTVDLDLQLNTVIPFWYEKIQLSFMGTSENLSRWVIRNVNEVTIMAYRNEIEGNNGIIRLIDEEIYYSLFSDANVIVTLETRPSSEGKHISFDKLGRERVFETIDTLKRQKEFKRLNIFYGVHDLESWLALE